VSADLGHAQAVRRLPPATPLLITVAVVLLLAVLSTAGESAVQIGQGWIPGFGPVDPAPPTEPDPSSRTDDFETPPALRAAAVIGLLAIMLYVLVVLLIGVVMLVAGVRRSRQRRRRRVSAADVEAAADQERGDAEPPSNPIAGRPDRPEPRAGGPPADAVVAAWLALERAGAEAGQARQLHETSTEYAAAVVTGLRLGDDAATAVHRLRGLYHRARYGGRGVGEADARAAGEALARVAAAPPFSERCDIVPVGPGQRHIVTEEVDGQPAGGRP
jgi:hypothetical protein